MTTPAALRLSAICGILSGLMIAIPGRCRRLLRRVDRQQSHAQSSPVLAIVFVVGLYARQAERAGSVGVVAYGANLIGTGLSAGVAFALNDVLLLPRRRHRRGLARGPSRHPAGHRRPRLCPGCCAIRGLPDPYAHSLARGRVDPYPRRPCPRGHLEAGGVGGNRAGPPPGWRAHTSGEVEARPCVRRRSRVQA